MSLPTSYLTSTKNFADILNAIQNAQAPETFTHKFLTTLGFPSSSDRLVIGVLKAIGLLDQNSIPTRRYFSFLDQSIAKQVLAEGIREAYSDLFLVNKNAQEMDGATVKNKLKTILEGKPSDDVLQKMATTFHALCEYADWTMPTANVPAAVMSAEEDKNEANEGGGPAPKSTEEGNLKVKKISIEAEGESLKKIERGQTELHYNIQIHLPETRDQAVYDAIFKSLRSHLL